MRIKRKAIGVRRGAQDRRPTDVTLADMTRTAILTGQLRLATVTFDPVMSFRGRLN